MIFMPLNQFVAVCLIRDIVLQSGTLKIQNLQMHAGFAVIPSVFTSNPSSRHTTRLSVVPQLRSHTVPQTLLLHISTRPIVFVEPPSSLMAPCGEQGVHLTPASWSCEQVCPKRA